MAHTNSLIHGHEARKIHAIKRDQLMSFSHKVHCVSSPVVSSLFGSSSSNSARLLSQMEMKGFMQCVHVPYIDLAPRGAAYILTQRGCDHATRHDYEPTHHYNTRPESIRLKQIEHDLSVAKIAASMACQGAHIELTDYMARQMKDAGESKIPDLVVSFESVRFQVEYERLTKSAREIDQMLMATFRAKMMPTLWVCATRAAAHRIRQVIQDQEVTQWRLNSGNKWSPGKKVFVPFDWRSRQVVVQSTIAEAAAYSMKQWQMLINDAAQCEHDKTINSFQTGGWSWTALKRDLRTDATHGFELSRHSANHHFTVDVAYSDEQWIVCSEDDPIAMGLATGRKRDALKIIGQLPPIGLVEAAINVINSNPDFLN